MSSKILVTFASRTGSTIGVANAIAKIISEGDEVDLLPMQDVSDLTAYRAVIAGSAIQASQWLPEAMQFLKTHQSALATKQLAVFSVCMILAMPNGEKYRSFVAQWQEPVRPLVKPIDEGYFAGKLDISKIPSFGKKIKFRISVLLGVWKPGDHRNWEAFHTWAKNLQKKL